MNDINFTMSFGVRDIRYKKIDKDEIAVLFVLNKYRGANGVALMTIGKIAEKMGYSLNTQIAPPHIQKITNVLSALVKRGLVWLSVPTEQITRISQVFEYGVAENNLSTQQIVKLTEEEFGDIFVKSSERNREDLLYDYLYVKSFYIQRVPRYECEIKHVFVETSNSIARKTDVCADSISRQLDALCKSGWLQRYEPTESWQGNAKDCPYLYIPSYLAKFKDRCLELAKNKLLFA